MTEERPHLDPYPSAPTDVEERRAWAQRRSAAFAAGVHKPVDGTTYGTGKVPGEKKAERR